MQFLKRLFFGQPDHTLPAADVEGLDLSTATLDEIVAVNIKLGEVIDQIRVKRRALNERAAQLREANHGQ